MEMIAEACCPKMSVSRRRGPQGFTIVEAAVASAMLALMISTLAVAFVQINHWASNARLKTLALTVAQQKVDEILATPWQIRNARPAVLAAGTVTENALRLNDDALNGQTGLSSGFTALDTPVPATRVTVVTDLPPRAVRATVTVTFVYRSRTYTTSLTTLRVTDDI